MSFLSLFKKTQKVVYPKKYLGVKAINHFEIRPLYDLKDNLLYMHAHILYEDSNVYIMAKKDKNVIYKYSVIKDLEKFKSLNLTNEMLVSLNLGREFKYGFVIEELGVLPMVEIVILENITDETIKYALSQPIPNKKLYKVGFVYDSEYHLLVQMSYLPEFGPLYSEFKIAIFKDIGAHDKENY